MALSRYSLIVAIDGGNGIAKEGEIPWQCSSDSKFFKETTTGKGKNAVIMGRITYESIPEQFRPLPNRICIVVSRLWKQEDHQGIVVCHSLGDALFYAGTSKVLEEVFVIGGEQIYKESIRDYLYLCNKMYITKFKMNYECDQFFPWDSVKDFDYFQGEQRNRDYVRYYLKPCASHPEYEYLNAMKKIQTTGESRMDRTGTGTISLFGDIKMEFDISERIPIITTKKVNYEHIIRELLFFISGKTDTKILEEHHIKIWKENTSRSFLDARGLNDYEVGDAGPFYSFQWRHWGAEYKGCDVDYSGEGIDQLSQVIRSIQEDPLSRRHILSAWNVSDLDKMALVPCHVLVQFNVSGDRRHLDCMLYQRSADFFLGVPYNITSYSILTYMIAHITGLKPRKFIHVCGDAHIYNNHTSQVAKQLSRTPKPFAKLSFRRSAQLKKIDDFQFDNFVVEGYSSWDYIAGSMAV